MGLKDSLSEDLVQDVKHDQVEHVLVPLNNLLSDYFFVKQEVFEG